MKFTIKVTGKLAGRDVEIAGEWGHPDSDPALGLAMKLALGDILGAFAEVEADNPTPKISESQLIVEGGELVATSERGQWRYRLHVGQWKKWGIPVYPEILNKEQEAHLQKAGSVDMGKYRAIIDLKADGNPKRVSRFEKVQE